MYRTDGSRHDVVWLTDEVRTAEAARDEVMVALQASYRSFLESMPDAKVKRYRMNTVVAQVGEIEADRTTEVEMVEGLRAYMMEKDRQMREWYCNSGPFETRLWFAARCAK